MRVIFAIWPTVDYQHRALTEQGADRRLLSFYFIKDIESYSMKAYVTEPPEEPKPVKTKAWGNAPYQRRRILEVIRRAKMGEEE